MKDSQNKLYDCLRTKELEELGLIVLRFMNDDVMLNMKNILKRVNLVIDEILGTCQNS
jgi:very-short-patch-repair endonuclease